jgi:hypothetical protein
MASAPRAPHHRRHPGGLRVAGHRWPECHAHAIAGRGGQHARRGPHLHLPALRLHRGAAPGWTSNRPATRQWNGKGAPGTEDSAVDLFSGPGGLEAWAVAAATRDSLAAYATAAIRAAAAAHPCPAVPQADQAITISGEPARLLGVQCPPGSGFLVETAVTIHAGTAFVFASQDPSGAAADHRANRAAFQLFLGGIRLPR